MKIAIVGSGVSGLVAARALHGRHAITVFEKDDYVGGHANTVVVREGQHTIGLDTGFLVYNERTYPRFTQLLSDLGVRTQPSEMSFSVQCRRCRIVYGSGSARSLFARPSAALRPTFLRMLVDVARFNRLGRHALAEGTTDGTLGEFLRRHRISETCVRHYVTPMAGAIWSSSAAGVERFALTSFLTFLDNHGLLGLTGQPQWRTITGGSRAYVAALIQPFADRVRLHCPVSGIQRLPHAVEVRCANGTHERFDKVVIATHADQALALLTDPSGPERSALAALRYQSNEAVLHSDPGPLPIQRHAWSSWNHHMDDCREVDRPVTVTYYLNRLQRLDSAREYFVTLNDDRIAAEHILARIPYQHPIFDNNTVAAQARLRALNGDRHTYFAGAYLGHGFHEDGVNAGLAVAALMANPDHGHMAVRVKPMPAAPAELCQ